MPTELPTEPSYIVRVVSPFPEKRISVAFSKEELQKMMRDALWNGVVASSAIEGIDLSHVPPPSHKTIPDSLLTW